MISAERALELSKEGVEKKIDLIERAVIIATMDTKTDVFVNSGNLTCLVKEKLRNLGYTIGLSNNGMTNISWKQ